MQEAFLRPKFEGGRFKDHRIPLDLLRELVLLEELILETARWQFMQQNPGKKRMPRGWRDGFRLSLAEVQGGSATPILVMEETEATQDLFFRQQFVAARDKLLEAIRIAGEQDGDIEILPRKLRQPFEKIGAGLRTGERISFVEADSSRSPAILNMDVRRRLIPRNAPYRNRHEVVGSVFEVDQKAKTFQILDEDGKRINARFSDEDHDRVLEVASAYRSGELFRISGDGLFNPDGTLKEIAETFDIEPAGQRIRELLVGIAALQQGWYDGTQGEEYSPEELHWLESAWYEFVPASLPSPVFFPDFGGSITVEWDIERWDVSLDIEAGNRTAFFHALNLENGEEHEMDNLDLTTPEAWERVVSTIQRMLGRDAEDV